MPARRQHRRGDGLTRKQRAAIVRAEQQAHRAWLNDPDREPTKQEIEWAWAEHQESERWRRAAPPLIPPPVQPSLANRRSGIDIRAVIENVMVDFMRWEIDRAEREQRLPTEAKRRPHGTGRHEA